MITSKLVLAILLLALSLGLASCNDADKQPAANQPLGASVGNTQQTVELRVLGMHCDNCVQSIQGNVAKLEGVETVSASFGNAAVLVGFDPGRTSIAEISAEIESLGFKVPGQASEHPYSAPDSGQAASDAAADSLAEDAADDSPADPAGAPDAG